jgi:hypothetical protein
MLYVTEVSSGRTSTTLLRNPSVEYARQLRHKTVMCLVVLPHQTVDCTRCYYVIHLQNMSDS